VDAVTLAGLTWKHTGASDVHLLPGLASPELKRLLQAYDLDPATKTVLVKELHNMPGLTVTFAAQFKGAPAAQGVELKPDTGEVRLTTYTGLRSFLVTATAKQGALEATARIRVNLHEAFLRPPWLTPSPLTVRKGAANVRLSVLAMFSDGVIGDITNWSPFEPPALLGVDHTYVHALGSDTPALTWKDESIPPGGTSAVGANEVTGVLDARAETGSSTITVRHGAFAASATVACAKPWSTPLNLTLVSGPGADAVSYVPNVLFLPDGFQDADRLKFTHLVGEVVEQLSTRPNARPFAAFAGRVNYWMAWVPSPQPGVSVLNELDRDRKNTRAGEGSTLELPSPRRPPATGRWTLEQLINEVGLPVPVGDPGFTVDQLVQVWQERYGPQVVKTKLAHLVPTWLTLADRVLLNERDTAFHIAYGDRPALDGTTSDRGLAPNPRRLHNDDFEKFLDNLHDPKGKQLPKLWTTEKDHDLVVMLCRSLRDGGLNQGRSPTRPGKLLGISLGDALTHQLEPDAANGWNVKFDPIPPRGIFRTWMTVAHELAHSWAIGDEYAEFAGAATPDKLADADQRANLQTRDTLLEPDGHGGTVLSPANIKWGFWPRIAKAAVLLRRPERVPGTSKLSLQLVPVPGPALPKEARFARGDVVRLRTRALTTTVRFTKPFSVARVDGIQLEIAPLDGHAVDDAVLDAYPANSIVMAAVQQPDPDPAHGDFGLPFGLMTDDVRGRIAFTHNPLNAQPTVGEAPAPNDPPNRACANRILPLPTPATNFPNRTAPKPPAFSAWTIGLYENGGEFTCGIYRPTGICIMCETDFETASGNVQLYEFCLVCRYAIVDAVDPRLHFEVEKDFRQRYGAVTELVSG
jgi:hypothetical protein